MATKSYVSAGVFTEEKDVSYLGAAVGEIGAAYIGTAPKGPAFVPVQVASWDEFVSYFGDLDQDFIMPYAAKAYLKNGNSASIVRVLGPAGRTSNGTAVTPGYTADSMWAVTGFTGSDGCVLALMEITSSSGLIVQDLGTDSVFLSAAGGAFSNGFFGAGITASFLSASTNYIGKVLNTDPTLFSTYGYYLKDVFDYSAKLAKDGNFNFWSASFALTDFTVGFNSGSSPWVKSQVFGVDTEYNLFKFHTLGHGNIENGRFKISISNVKPSSNTDATQYGTFTVEVRDFNDTDEVPTILESFENVTLDPTSPNYVLAVIGDTFWTYNFTKNKMVQNGDYSNGSKLIRIEMNTIPFPKDSLPWGFRGLAKPALMAISGSTSITNGLKDIPYVANMFNKAGSGETSTAFYWGMESVLSGNIKARLNYLPGMTGSDTDFSLTFVSGNSIETLSYNASNPTDSKKSPGDTLGHTTLDSTYAKFTMPIAFGFDGFSPKLANPVDNVTQMATLTQLGTQAMRQGIDIVADPDFIDINMIVIPGVYSSKVTDYAMTKARDRGDTFYPMDISGSSVDFVVQQIKNRKIDNNYCSVYYPDVRVLDPVNGGMITLPASAVAGAAIAYNDSVSYAWFAPAGLNRAGLSSDVIGFDGARPIESLTQAERDKLYENRINPIARFSDAPHGVIWGQKNLQMKSSALDRINVRRLLIRTKKFIASASRYLVFEASTGETMTRFKQLVNPYMQEVMQKQGLTDFRVVMDSTNNKPETIDKNMLIGQIWMIPARTAEVIKIDFIVSPTGAVFGND